ncbi:MAG TPA: phosphatase PAP2 family protein [Thermoanaerobaculia bacterium]|nr:phosphatase PAP2 family protein [Thermoanaerobaculia bacterium]
MLWKPVDVLTSAFAGLLFAAGLARFQALEDRSVLLRMIVVAAIPALVAILRARHPNPSKNLQVFLDFYVIACVLAIFDGLGPLIRAVHPVDYDGALIAFDRALFGTDPTAYLERFATPFLSDVLTLFYALYYFHPIVLGMLVLLDDAARPARALDFPRYAFVMVFVFYVSYACYFLVPSIGPRYTVAHAGPLPRGAIAQTIDHTLDILEKNKRDCFPSGHTMVLTAILLEAYRRSKGTFWVFLPFAAGLFIATVYCRYHYVADVIAGFALAFVTVPLGNALYRRFDRSQPGSEAPEPGP